MEGSAEWTPLTMKIILFMQWLLYMTRKNSNYWSAQSIWGRQLFLYVSGLFFLREGPFVCEAISKLRNKPDLVCFDAQGLAHPRKMGLATICGMILGMPSIGISKTRLVGEMEDYKDGLKRLVIGNEQVGYVTSNPKRYWSPGFSIRLDGLENIIVNQRDICLRSINESHQRAVQLSQDRRR